MLSLPPHCDYNWIPEIDGWLQQISPHRTLFCDLHQLSFIATVIIKETQYTLHVGAESIPIDNMRK